MVELRFRNLSWRIMANKTCHMKTSNRKRAPLQPNQFGTFYSMLVMLLWVCIHTGQAWKIRLATVGNEPTTFAWCGYTLRVTSQAAYSPEYNFIRYLHESLWVYFTQIWSQICFALRKILNMENSEKFRKMDQSPINQNFELNKSRQNFHHSLKEHHKISNILKFRCKML
jgi:hypothetical protein